MATKHGLSNLRRDVSGMMDSSWDDQQRKNHVENPGFRNLRMRRPGSCNGSDEPMAICQLSIRDVAQDIALRVRNASGWRSRHRRCTVTGTMRCAAQETQSVACSCRPQAVKMQSSIYI